jgi:FMN-dependent NADH-azoreductase
MSGSKHLLHLDSSPRTQAFSRILSQAFATSWDGSRSYRDLSANPVPPIDGAWTELCDYILEHEITDIRRYGEAARTDGQQRAWAVVRPLLAELAAADVVLIGAPMYNFSITSALKAWIDQVTFPKMSLAGRTFVVTGARGGAYGPGTPRERYDHHERYLRDFFEGHFAVTDCHFIHVELVNSRLDPALASRRDQHEASYASAVDRARSLARELMQQLAAPPAGGAAVPPASRQAGGTQ